MNRKDSERELALQVTAIHEAGHAVYAWFSPYFKTVHVVTIRPNDGVLGRTFDERRSGPVNKQGLIDEIASYLAGMVAEELSGYGRTTSNDLPEATAKAEEMVREFGMGRRVRLRFIDDHTTVSPWLKSSIDRDIREIMDQAYRQAQRIIAKHLDQVKAVAELLLKSRHVSDKELKKLLGPKA